MSTTYLKLVCAAISLAVAGLGFADVLDTSPRRYIAAGAMFVVVLVGLWIIVLDNQQRDKYRNAHLGN